MDPSIASFMAKKKIDIAGIMDFLKIVVYHIFASDFKEFRYNDIHTHIYNLVVTGEGETLYKNLISWINENIEILSKTIRNVEESITLLNNIQNVWSIITRSIEAINGVCLYLNGNTIKQKALKEIPFAGYSYFIEYALEKTGNLKRLKAAALDEIIKDRSGELIDKTVLKNISQMLIKLSKETRLPLYEEYIEDAYLINTIEFYTVESNEMIKKMIIPDYLKHAEKRIDNELKRCEGFVTQDKIKIALNNVFISEKIDLIFPAENNVWILSVVQNIQNEKTEDIKRIYRIFNSMLNKDHFHKFVEEFGKALELDGLKNISENKAEQNTLKLIENIIILVNKYKTYLIEYFNNNQELKARIERGFENFINAGNTVLQALPIYCDNFLTKKAGNIEPADQDKIIEGILTIFKNIKSKDKFEELYRRNMARRLLCKTTANDDIEGIIITKLKAECGPSYVKNLEVMLKDISNSREEIVKYYADHFKYAAELEKRFDVRVLTQNSWPIENIQIVCKLPQEIDTMRMRFENFYMQRHSGRKLMWRIDKGNVEVIAYFGSKHYEFTMKIFQCVVLMLFNENEELTIEEISPKTAIAEKDVESILQMFMKGNLIEVKEIQGSENKAKRVYSVNPKFVYKNLLFNRFFLAILCDLEKIMIFCKE